MSMARIATARRPAPVNSQEPEGLTFGAMKAAAEVYWPGLGGKVADQFREWNKELFDGKLRPAPMVISRMSSIHGHWFPLLDRSADQRIGTEVHLVTQVRAYMPPTAVPFVRRADLLRGMMDRLQTQDGLVPWQGNSPEWCQLVMNLHHRLTGERIWCAPVREVTVPQQDLGKGLYRPAETHILQENDPRTGAESLPRNKIVAWPGSVMDLGRITGD
jgi:hypothetical protein